MTERDDPRSSGHRGPESPDPRAPCRAAPYLAFLVRLWNAAPPPDVALRVTVSDLRDGSRLSYDNLETALDRIRLAVRERMRRADPEKEAGHAAAPPEHDR